jgi:hypothetical protein
MTGTMAVRMDRRRSGAVAVPKVATRTGIVVTGKRVVGKRLTTLVVVRAPGLVAAGRVEVRDGTKVVARGTLGADGAVRLTLPKLRRGTHRLKAVFAGSAETGSSTSATAKVTVRRR